MHFEKDPTGSRDGASLWAVSPPLLISATHTHTIIGPNVKKKQYINYSTGVLFHMCRENRRSLMPADSSLQFLTPYPLRTPLPLFPLLEYDSRKRTATRISMAAGRRPPWLRFPLHLWRRISAKSDALPETAGLHP